MSVARVAWRAARVVLHALSGLAQILIRFPRLSQAQRDLRVQAWASRLVQLLGVERWSTAERKAAIELARAQAIRPQLVGKALQETSSDPEVSEAVFEILETQRLLENKGSLVMFRCGTDPKLLGALLASEQSLVGRG